MSVPNERQTLLAFRIGEEHYALPVEVVRRVVQMVALTPLPGAPEKISGIINVAGEVIPAVSVRHVLGREEAEVSPDAHLCITRTSRRAVALIVDAADGVVEYGPADLVPAVGIIPELEHVKGVVKLADGLVLINDVETFLSLDDHRRLDGALKTLRKKKSPQ